MSVETWLWLLKPCVHSHHITTFAILLLTMCYNNNIAWTVSVYACAGSFNIGVLVKTVLWMCPLEPKQLGPLHWVQFSLDSCHDFSNCVWMFVPLGSVYFIVTIVCGYYFCFLGCCIQNHNVINLGDLANLIPAKCINPQTAKKCIPVCLFVCFKVHESMKISSVHMCLWKTPLLLLYMCK